MKFSVSIIRNTQWQIDYPDGMVNLPLVLCFDPNLMKYLLFKIYTNLSQGITNFIIRIHAL